MVSATTHNPVRLQRHQDQNISAYTICGNDAATAKPGKKTTLRTKGQTNNM